MTRFLLGCFLAIAAIEANAQANWVKFGEIRNENNVLDGIEYVDRDGLRRNGNLVRAAFLSDFRKTFNYHASGAKQVKVRSYVHQFEFDCQRRQYRFTRSTFYAGPMGSGAVRHDEDNESIRKWGPVYDGILEDTAKAFEYACPGAKGKRRR
jgi:hypothetical protein